jgi:hypothetical protein
MLPYVVPAEWMYGYRPYIMLLNVAQLSMFVAEVNAAVSWAIYSAKVEFFWRDSWSYLRCRCTQSN